VVLGLGALHGNAADGQGPVCVLHPAWIIMMSSRKVLLGCCLIAGSGCSSSKVTDAADAAGAVDVGRDADAGEDFQAELSAAAALWASSKQTCPVYTYARGFRSVFGSYSTTIIDVANDVVTRRHYFFSPPAGVDAGSDGWDETGTELGSHANSPFGPFPAQTVEGLLSECATILAHDPKVYRLDFRADDRGVPELCVSTPINCEDDCTQGIVIDPFSCAPASASDGGHE
jgi:hypothetical protein